ncbi:O-Antigen ligase [Planctomycetes bacterium Pan216]|uniref:O-Antigen ligase n=2 Tax=Kolteria novifilia TaxID=2527975 RepID=A0A518B6C2_9BACT|nr:O-Antigen ligase [Planctomycetes bacterium Pan216]
MVFLSPWPLGAIFPRDMFLIYVGVSLLLLSWAVRIVAEGELRLARCPVVPCLLLLALLAWFQTISFSPETLGLLSGNTARVYDEFLPSRPEVLPFDVERMPPAYPAGSTISFYPGATQREAVGWLAVFLLFLGVRHVLNSPDHLRRLSLAATINASLLAFFGLVHYFSAETSYAYWSIETDSNIVFGPFVNRSHYAFYQNLCTGLALGWTLQRLARGEAKEGGEGSPRRESGRRHRRKSSFFSLVLQDPAFVWMGLALVLIFAATIFCQSRGGTIAFLSGFGMVVLLSRTGSFDWKALALFAGIVVASTLMLLWFGFEPVLNRLNTLWEGDALNPRTEIWGVSLPAFWSHPVWGTGYGTFYFIERMNRVLGTYRGRVAEHAHNEYIEAMVEGGLIRLVLTLLLIGFLFWLGVKALRRQRGSVHQGLVLGAIFAVTTAAVHSIGEFGIHMPSIAVLLTVIGAMLAGTVGWPMVAKTKRQEIVTPRNDFTLRWGGIAPTLAAVVLVALGLFLSYEGWRLARYDALRRRAEVLEGGEHLRERLDLMTEAARLVPESSKIHLQLGRELIGAGAALARQKDVDQQLYINLSLEGLRRILLARDLCPLLVDSQVSIAEYRGLLQEGDPASDYVERAKRLLPADSRTWFTFGFQALQAGDEEETWRCFRRSLEISGDSQKRILELSKGRLSSEAILEKVLPENPQLIFSAGRSIHPGPKGRDARGPYVERALELLEERDGELTEAELFLKGNLLEERERYEEARVVYQRAVIKRPTKHDWRYRYAEVLFELGDYRKAVREAEIILVARPRDKRVKSFLEKASRRLAETK